jgi:hypothetical protein
MISFAFERTVPVAGVTQLVECNLAKVDVAGSNPVSRSKSKIVRPGESVSMRFANLAPPDFVFLK